MLTSLSKPCICTECEADVWSLKRLFFTSSTFHSLADFSFLQVFQCWSFFFFSHACSFFSKLSVNLNSAYHTKDYNCMPFLKCWPVLSHVKFFTDKQNECNQIMQIQTNGFLSILKQFPAHRPPQFFFAWPSRSLTFVSISQVNLYSYPVLIIFLFII